MVEGINIRQMVHVKRMDNLIEPGCILLFAGLLVPVLFEIANYFTGRFSARELDILNGILSMIMASGLVLIAYGLTYRRAGDILLPLEFCLLMLGSIDLIFWVYFVWLNWIPSPSDIFIFPYAPPGDIPLLLTVFFMIFVLAARFTYSRDPRKAGKPKYIK